MPWPSLADRARSWWDAVPPTRRLVGAGVAALVLVAAVVAVLGGRTGAGSGGEVRLPMATTAVSSAAVSRPGATLAGEGDVVVVYVAGAVVHPGLVRLPTGSRVDDAVRAAGGPAPDADLDQLNLAAVVADALRVYVPRHGEAPPPTVGPDAGAGAAMGGAAAPVNLNSATAEQLDTLPGVGPATAAAIIEYRQRHGPFSSVDELGEVPGIGPAKLAALRDKVMV